MFILYIYLLCDGDLQPLLIYSYIYPYLQPSSCIVKSRDLNVKSPNPRVPGEPSQLFFPSLAFHRAHRKGRLQAHATVSHEQIPPPTPRARTPSHPPRSTRRGEPGRRIWRRRRRTAGPSRSGRRTCSSRRATPSSGRNASAPPSTPTPG